MLNDFDLLVQKIRATVVFDGVEPVDKNRHKPRPHIRVIYSHHHSADSEIIHLIDGQESI